MPSLILSVFSLDNLGVPHTEQNDLCYLPRHEWLRLIHLDCPDILLVDIRQGDVRRVLTVGDAHDRGDAVFIPYNCIGAFEEGGDVLIQRYLGPVPIATLITIQPLETELYQCDIAAAVSKVLANMNILHNHTTLRVPCPELDGYIVDVFIKDCEPADIVLLRGECPLEISQNEGAEAEVASIEPVHPVGVYIPANQVVPIPEISEETIAFPSQSGFAAFSGTGRRLGS